MVQEGVRPASDDSRAEVGGAVDKTLEQGIREVKLLVVEVLSTVDCTLVHALHDGRAGAESAEEVQLEGLAPAVGELAAEDVLVLLGDILDVLEGAVLVVHLRDEGALAEDVAVLGHAPLLDEGIDVGEELVPRESGQGVGEESAESRLASTAVALVAGGALLVDWRGGRANIVRAAGAAGAGHIVAGVVVGEVRVRSLIVNPWGRHGDCVFLYRGG